MNFMLYLNQICGYAFCVLYAYTLVYMVYSFLSKKKLPHKPEKPHRYAVLIAARNEELVLPQLIRSIRSQNYDQKRITIFVIADNCTDHTAQAARKAGAVVYERQNQQLIGKGYAMDELIKHILADYPDHPFDGFFVFDADNVLQENYISEMNKVFSDGYPIITGYRNSKNFGDNWITAGYGFAFLREAKYLNHARMLLGNSSAVSGTGYLVSWDIVKKYNGWPFHLLTEDLEFTAQSIIKGDKIGYCGDAIFYDEQPVDLKVSLRQRMRWAKGSLQVFRHYGWGLLKTAFKGSFSAFDMFMILIPLPAFMFFLMIVNLVCIFAFLIAGNGPAAMVCVMSLINFILSTYGGALAAAFLTVLTESKRIHIPTKKKILYMFTFPLFVFTSMPLSFRAFYKKVTWTPIIHTQVKTVSDIHKENK